MSTENVSKEQIGSDANRVLAAGTFQVTVRTSDFRGDHATDVEDAILLRACS